MDNSKDRYLGQLLDDRYEILEVIGSGGMAVVYKALCHRLNRHVAVKMLKDDLALDEEFRRRFQKESQAVAMLSHPNIVSVYDFGHSDDHEYIVMELIEGITLKQYMQKKGAIGWKEALHFATQISKALSHAHSRGIIHRDIKPHNIMIVKDGSIKVADFGIARLTANPNTMTQEALGSVHYISPEQAKGGVADERADVYSVGVVMYEMLTGRLPFEGENAVSVAIQHISGVAPMPREINREIPRGLESITMKAMNPSLEERYPSADALLADLEDFRKSQTLAMPVPAAAGAYGNQAPVPADRGQRHIIHRNVRPVSTSGELSGEGYSRRRSRSKKVSLLSGILGVMVVILALSVFLWNFWLRDLFSEPERINIPKFIGSNYEEIVENEEYLEIFNFTVKHKIDANSREGEIIDQYPEPGKSYMLVPERIDVELIVSSGEKTVAMPNVLNEEYRAAKMELEELGLEVEIVTVASATITKGYVVESIPGPGEEAAVGSTVQLSVSGGPEIVPLNMPSLIGMSEASAKSTLEGMNLVMSESYVDSDKPVGTVVWQTPDAGVEVEEHSKVYVQISSGPKATPTPSPTTTPTDNANTPEPPPVQDDPPDTEP